LDIQRETIHPDTQGQSAAIIRTRASARHPAPAADSELEEPILLPSGSTGAVQAHRSTFHEPGGLKFGRNHASGDVAGSTFECRSYPRADNPALACEVLPQQALLRISRTRARGPDGVSPRLHIRRRAPANNFRRRRTKARRSTFCAVGRIRRWRPPGGKRAMNSGRRLIKYPHLVANPLIFHNVVTMTKAL
jgi:hypothetical protein